MLACQILGKARDMEDTRVEVGASPLKVAFKPTKRLLINILSIWFVIAIIREIVNIIIKIMDVARA